jgi:protocatechuate 4,5-dioxygenase, alpha chain
MNATFPPISQPISHADAIPGTTIFGPAEAMRGYALNAMCYSFNQAANRDAFRADEDAYCTLYGLSDEQRAAVAARDVLGMIAAGGNIYYLAKLAGILGLNVQDVGALQTGTSVDGFKQMLLDQGTAYRAAIGGETRHG